MKVSMGHSSKETRSPYTGERNESQSSRAHNTSEQMLQQKIEQLEYDLHQKDSDLQNCLKQHLLMREQLRDMNDTLESVARQIVTANNDYKMGYRKMLDLIAALEQENKGLSCSNNAWSERSIKLEFESLTTQNEIETIKYAYGLALSVIAMQGIELNAIKEKPLIPQKLSDLQD